MARYEGRLELTWTNKDQCLLAPDDGSYEWLPPSDYRVAEVRLLDDVATFGEVGKRRMADNLLIEGDALHALTSLIKLPEFRREFAGRIKLAYIDPPFNTGQAFEQYDDALEHSVWLTMMRDRLVQINELLSADGTVWVHLDDAELHRAQLVLDEVFGPNNFVSAIIWRSSDNSNNDALQFSSDHNTILVYSKGKDWTSNRRQVVEGELKHYSNPDNDPLGPWFDGNPLNSPSPRENLRYSITSPTSVEIPPPPNGWRWSKATLMAKIESGEVRFTPDGRGIRRRTYLRDHRGLPPTTLWVDLEETGHNRQAKYELRGLFPGVSTSQLFATPKPERLMKKILEVATRPGDIVLDAFAGSGTTAAVAHKLGRRWVAIERSADTISRFTLPRLQQVIDGSDQGGVSTVTTNVSESEAEGVRLGEGKIAARVIEAMAKAEELPVEKADVVALVKALRARDRTETNSVWAGGGGIRVLRVASSMFDAEGGMVFLADAMANGRLAEATAAQLGFSYEVEPPFSGRKGRARLAVIDGVVNEGVVKLLVVALAEGERVVVCGTGIDPDARTLLKELAPGSTLRKIPAALLDRYRASESAARRTRATVGTATTGQS